MRNDVASCNVFTSCRASVMSELLWQCRIAFPLKNRRHTDKQTFHSNANTKVACNAMCWHCHVQTNLVHANWEFSQSGPKCVPQSGQTFWAVSWVKVRFWKYNKLVLWPWFLRTMWPILLRPSHYILGRLWMSPNVMMVKCSVGDFSLMAL